MIHGEDGNDRLYGGGGNDHVIGEIGNDYLNGGFGIDVLSYAGRKEKLNIDFLTNKTIVEGPAKEKDTIAFFEDVIGGDNDDEIEGNHNDNLFRGGNGDDLLSGGSGVDTLKGEGGNDLIVGGPGLDKLDGGPGTDTLHFFKSPFAVVIDLRKNKATFESVAGAESLLNFENAIGTHHKDRITGDEKVNSLSGDFGNDIIRAIGNAGSKGDKLQGGMGFDELYGSDDDDTIGGGGDSDQLKGGDGDGTLRGDFGGDDHGGGNAEQTSR